MLSRPLPSILIRLLFSLALIVVSSGSLLASAQSEASHLAAAEHALVREFHHPGPTLPHKHEGSQASKNHGTPQPTCVLLEKFSAQVAIGVISEMVAASSLVAQWAVEGSARAIELLHHGGPVRILQLLVLSLASAPLAPPAHS